MSKLFLEDKIIESFIYMKAVNSFCKKSLFIIFLVSPNEAEDPQAWK